MSTRGALRAWVTENKDPFVTIQSANLWREPVQICRIWTRRKGGSGFDVRCSRMRCLSHAGELPHLPSPVEILGNRFIVRRGLRPSVRNPTFRTRASNQRDRPSDDCDRDSDDYADDEPRKERGRGTRARTPLNYLHANCRGDRSVVLVGHCHGDIVNSSLGG